MWSAELSRRELFEFYLGSTKLTESRVRKATRVQIDAGSNSVLLWNNDPTTRFTLPTLVIVPDEEEVKAVLGAIAASPQAPSPISGLSRVVTQSEAKHHFDDAVLSFEDRVLPALASLTFIEAVLHGGGRLGLRQLSPLFCKRTLSYAWGKALVAEVDPQSFVELPGRWLDVYSDLNPQPMVEAAHRVVTSMIKALSHLGNIAMGHRPDSAPGNLAFELLFGSKDSQESAWKQLSQAQIQKVSIEELQTLAREDRASFLQDALRALGSPEMPNGHAQDDLAATCAFLATRLAPGSLEHLDVLRSAGHGNLLAWYGLYAALQSPKEMMSLFGGLGHRVLRDLGRTEEKLDPPSADVSYPEFKVLARGSLENLASRLGHVSELQVEVVPYVCTSFTFHLRRGIRQPESQQSLDMDHPEQSLSVRARVAQLAAELAHLAKNLPDHNEDSQQKKGRRR